MDAYLYVTRIDDVIFHRWYCTQCRPHAPAEARLTALREHERQVCDRCGRTLKGDCYG